MIDTFLRLSRPVGVGLKISFQGRLGLSLVAVTAFAVSHRRDAYFSEPPPPVKPPGTKTGEIGA